MDNAQSQDQRSTRGLAWPAVVAVLLAAGSSSRFGAENKLLADVAGEALVVRVARALLSSRIAGVVVVTPADPTAISTAIGPLRRGQSSRLRLVANPDPTRGISSSIAIGIGAVPAAATGALIVPGDMPSLTPSTCDTLVSVFESSGGDAVIHAATPDGGQRNPVIWPRRLFASLMALEGDTGGKPLIACERAVRPGHVIAVPFAAPDLFLDIDVPDDLARWR